MNDQQGKPVVPVPRRLMNMKEAASYLRMSVYTLRRMGISGEIEVVRRPGPWSRWQFDKRDLDRWIEEHKGRIGS